MEKSQKIKLVSLVEIGLYVTAGWSEPNVKAASKGTVVVAKGFAAGRDDSSKNSSLALNPAPNASSLPSLLTDNQTMGQQLMAWGRKYEMMGQLQNALRCYQTALLMVPEEAKLAVTAVLKKIKLVEEQQQMNEAIHALMSEVDRGNGEAAFKLGKLYWEQNDFSSAEKMWVKASELKHAEATYRLAKMYEKGDHVAVNMPEAEKYYRKGALLDHPECLYVTSKLIEMEAQGDSTGEKMGLARAYKEKAANLDHVLAAIEVAFAYAKEKDHTKAKLYFEKAHKCASPTETVMMLVPQLTTYCMSAEALWGMRPTF